METEANSASLSERTTAVPFREFQTKPVRIQAEQWFPGVVMEGVSLVDWEQLSDWLKTFPLPPLSRTEKHAVVKTNHGTVYVSPGDWIIKGVGEFYPCKPAVFAAKYEEVAEDYAPGNPNVRMLEQLKRYLRLIEEHDTDYEVRNPLIIPTMAYAHRLGLRVGFRLDPKEPEWPVAFIQLPTGQVSWHLPQFPNDWDGHTTEEKYRRIQEFCNGNG